MSSAMTDRSAVTSILRVENMDCADCAVQIENVIGNLPGPKLAKLKRAAI